MTKRPKIYVQGSDLPRSVQINAHVLPRPDSAYPVVLKPYKLDISQFGEAKRTKASFKVNNVSNQDLEIQILDYQSEFFSVKLPSSVKAGESVTGEVTVNKNKVENSFEKSMTLALLEGKDNKPVHITLPVRRSVRKLSSTLDSAMTSTPGGGGSK
ncbi:MAG: hypothetical protein ACE5GA_05775 [Candidatus Zixiibacteriota bacterium]